MRGFLNVALVAVIALTALCGFSMVAKEVTPEMSMQSTLIDQHTDASIAVIDSADPEGRDPGERAEHRAPLFSVSFSDEDDDCSGPLVFYGGAKPAPV